MTRSVVLRSLAACSLALAASAQFRTYSVEVVPTPAGGWVPGSVAIADGGLVAFEEFWPPPLGGPQVSPESRAFVWDGASLRELDRPATATYLSIQRVTASGRVCGGLRGSDYLFITACTWNDLGAVRVLRPPSGARCYAADANGSDLAVGGAFFPSSAENRAVIWQGGVLAVLPLPAGDFGGWATSVNDKGWILGTGVSPGAPTLVHPWLQPPLGAPGDLGMPAGTSRCDLSDLNTQLEAVGTAYAISNGFERGVRWGLGGYQELVPPVGAERTSLARLNRWGTAVGYGRVGPQYRALVAEGDQMAWLDDQLDASGAGWSLTDATDIANDGRIVAVADPIGGPSFSYRILLLTPLP
jgi:hypothetical protein